MVDGSEIDRYTPVGEGNILYTTDIEMGTWGGPVEASFDNFQALE